MPDGAGSGRAVRPGEAAESPVARGPARRSLPRPMGAANVHLRRARWAARARVAERSVYLPLARRRHGERMLADDTEVVIDGFTRTACVFATIAFQLAQPRPVRLAHVLHAPAHVMAAVRRGTPVLLTVRDPEGSIVSCMVREPHVSAATALKAYCRFYEALWPYRSGFVVGDFPRVTGDIGGVVRELNQRFGTRFATPDPAAVTSEAFRIIEDRARRPAWDAWIGHFMCGSATLEQLDAMRDGAGQGGRLDRFEQRAARPSVARQAMKRALSDAYAHPSHARLRARAERLYAKYAGAAAA